MARYAILQSFYASDDWIKFRLGLIAERGPYCQKCGRLIANHIDIIGHHKIPLTPENVHDRMISLNPENVDLVCFDCHNEIENRFGHYKQRGVYIVFGAPLSGKHTLVQQRVSRGDIIIDMDRLYAAVSGLPSYDKPDGLLSNVRGIYNLLLDNIKTRYGKWNSAWIIGGYADRHKREKLAEDLGAELIFCNVSKEECLQRLAIDEARRYRKDEWQCYIEKWFDEYIA
jgi:predicted kinase